MPCLCSSSKFTKRVEQAAAMWWSCSLKNVMSWLLWLWARAQCFFLCYSLKQFLMSPNWPNLHKLLRLLERAQKARRSRAWSLLSSPNKGTAHLPLLAILKPNAKQLHCSFFNKQSLSREGNCLLRIKHLCPSVHPELWSYKHCIANLTSCARWKNWTGMQLCELWVFFFFFFLRSHLSTPAISLQGQRLCSEAHLIQRTWQLLVLCFLSSNVSINISNNSTVFFTAARCRSKGDY